MANFLEEDLQEILKEIPNGSSKYGQARLKEAILLLGEAIDDLNNKIDLQKKDD